MTDKLKQLFARVDEILGKAKQEAGAEGGLPETGGRDDHRP